MVMQISAYVTHYLILSNLSHHTLRTKVNGSPEGGLALRAAKGKQQASAHHWHLSLSFPASLGRNRVSPRILNPCNSDGFGCVYLHRPHPRRRHSENERQPNSGLYRSDDSVQP